MHLSSQRDNIRQKREAKFYLSFLVTVPSACGLKFRGGVLMFSPKEIALNYNSVAKGKVSLKWYKMLVLAVLAGAFIALGGVVATFAGGAATGYASSLLKAAVFPLGLILVVICGAELFTGNCLLLSPLLSREIKLSDTLKSWGIVYIGNFLGAVLIAVLAVYSQSLKGLADSVVGAANAKVEMGFLSSFLRGILCNMLVCLAVWAGMSGKTTVSKIVAIYLPVFAFVACGFEHSVANMYYLTAGLLAPSAYGVAAGESLNVGTALVGSLLPSTLGNVVGGFLIALAYWFVYCKEGKKAVEQEKQEEEREETDKAA